MASDASEPWTPEPQRPTVSAERSRSLPKSADLESPPPSPDVIEAERIRGELTVELQRMIEANEGAGRKWSVTMFLAWAPASPSIPFESTPELLQQMPPHLHGHWADLCKRLRDRVAGDIRREAVDNEAIKKMFESGYQLTLVSGLKCLQRFTEMPLMEVRFQESSARAIASLVKVLPGTCVSEASTKPPWPPNKPVAFWSPLTTPTQTGDTPEVGKDSTLKTDETVESASETGLSGAVFTRSQFAPLISNLSDADRAGLAAELAHCFPRNALFPDATEAPELVESFNRLAQYPGTVRRAAIAEFSRILTGLADMRISAESPADQAKKKAALLEAIQNAATTLDAQLTFNGQPCNIWLEPANDDYSSGRYRVRTVGAKTDNIRRVNFPPTIGARPIGPG